MRSRTRVVALISAVLLLLGCTAAVAIPVPNPDPCDALYKSNTIANLKAYDDCRFDRIEAAIPGNQTVTVTPAPVTITAPPVTSTVTVTASASPTPTSTQSTSTSTSASPTSTSASPTSTSPTPSQPPTPAGCIGAANTPGGPDPWGGCWPGPASTGIAGCPVLTVHEGDYWLGTGDALENTEVRGQLRVAQSGAKDIKVTCVKVTAGNQYFPVDTERGNVTGPDMVIMDRIEVDCQGSQMANAAMLVFGATVRHARVSNCPDAFRIQDHSLVEDSYCGGLNVNGDTNNEWHYDCAQTIGAVNLTVRHNTLDGKDTSDVALWPDIRPIDGAMVERNLLLGDVAYKVYVGKGNHPGETKNVTVRDNRFGPGGYGPCSVDEAAPVWSGNVWNDNSAALPMSACS